MGGGVLGGAAGSSERQPDISWKQSADATTKLTVLRQQFLIRLIPEEHVHPNLEGAGNYLSDYVEKNGPQLENWIKDELEFAESQFAEMFVTLADKTRLELDALAEHARQVGVWHTGEITNVGVLYCQSCDEVLHFKKPGHIPPCPKCKGTVYKKVFNKNN